MLKWIFYSCNKKALGKGVHGSVRLCWPFPGQDPCPQQQFCSHPCPAREGRGQGHSAGAAAAKGSSFTQSSLPKLFTWWLSSAASLLLFSPLPSPFPTVHLVMSCHVMSCHIILPPASYKKCKSLISLRCPLCITSTFLIRHSASWAPQACSGADLPWHSQQLLCLDTCFQVKALTGRAGVPAVVLLGFLVTVYEISAVYKLFLSNIIIFSVV